MGQLGACCGAESKLTLSKNFKIYETGFFLFLSFETILNS